MSGTFLGDKRALTTSAPTGYPQPASLVLPPRSDRSLRPRRALAQDHHTTATRRAGARANSRGARSEARSSEVSTVLRLTLRALGTLAPNPGQWRSAVALALLSTLRASLRSTSAPRLIIDLLPTLARMTVYVSLRQTSSRPFVHMDSHRKIGLLFHSPHRHICEPEPFRFFREFMGKTRAFSGRP